MATPSIARTSATLSRRAFLGTGACLAGRALLPPAPAWAAEPLIAPPSASRVVRVRSQYAVDGATTHPSILTEMLEECVTTLTGTGSLSAAWRAILKPGDVVGLKFNSSAQESIGTTPGVASAIIESILNSGFNREQIVCIEAPRSIAARYRIRLPDPGYEGETVDFGSGADQLAAVLQQVTAIVNVPFLKTHNIAGMTCALKNLSHAFVRHPARYHDSGCAPYIGDIVALPAIRDKLRLCLVDALRVVYDGGPEPSGGTISDEGVLLASFDPVAAEMVGFASLNGIRGGMGLPAIAQTPADLPYLVAAHRRGLGRLAEPEVRIVERKIP